MNALKFKKITFGVLLLCVLEGQAFWSDFWTTPKTPNFEQIQDSKQRKIVFFNYLQPIIEKENKKILLIRQLIKNDKFSLKQQQKLAKKYRIKNPTKSKLLHKIDIIPVSLVLAQAAIESNWGRSRFSKYWHNYFGIWCFESGCGVVPKKRHENAKHEIAMFSSPSKSIEYYLLNINRNFAYVTLRKIREHKRDNDLLIKGAALAEGLDNYAQIGYEYVEIVQAVMRHNQLARYDALAQ